VAAVAKVMVRMASAFREQELAVVHSRDTSPYLAGLVWIPVPLLDPFVAATMPSLFRALLTDRITIGSSTFILLKEFRTHHTTGTRGAVRRDCWSTRGIADHYLNLAAWAEDMLGGAGVSVSTITILANVLRTGVVVSARPLKPLTPVTASNTVSRFTAGGRS
jgi:hypothetical protein